MSYIPPHMRAKVPIVLPLEKKGVRFIGNALGTTNVSENTGIRFSPNNRSGLKSSLKVKRNVISNGYVPFAPKNNLKNMPAKFREAAAKHILRKTFKRRR